MRLAPPVRTTARNPVLDEVLANARQTAAGMFVVPRVVDG